MTNTRLTDPEVLERRYPVRLVEFKIRRGSGGQGQQRGGDGVVTEHRVFAAAACLAADAAARAGAAAGAGRRKACALGHNTLQRRDGRVEHLPALAQFDAQAGDRLILETPGGGGWGSADQSAGEGRDHSDAAAT